MVHFRGGSGSVASFAAAAAALFAACSYASDFGAALLLGAGVGDAAVCPCQIQTSGPCKALRGLETLQGPQAFLAPSIRSQALQSPSGVFGTLRKAQNKAGPTVLSGTGASDASPSSFKVVNGQQLNGNAKPSAPSLKE